MAYDEDDIILIAGSGVHRSVIHAKLAPQGWSKEQVAALTDDEIKVALGGKMRPPAGAPAATQPKLAAQPVVEQQAPKGLINLDELDSTADTEVMGVGAPPPAAEMTSGVQPKGPLPPLPKIASAVAAPKPGAPVNPYLQSQPAERRIDISKEKDVEISRPECPYPSPSNDPKRLIAILEAAATMVSPPRVGPATKEQARRLVVEHNLRAAFVALYPRQAAKLFDEAKDAGAQTQPANRCEGGVILAVEESTSIHIITNAGVLSVHGKNLRIERQEHA